MKKEKKERISSIRPDMQELERITVDEDERKEMFYGCMTILIMTGLIAFMIFVALFKY